MPLTMTPEEFESIRQRVIERRAIKQAEEVLREMERVLQKEFATVDSFMLHLDALLDSAKDRQPRRSRRKGR